MKWLAAVALAACAHAPAKPAQPTPSVRDEIAQAELAERQRRHDIARAHYERAVASARDPDSIAFARHEFAETLITWGELTEAIAQLEAAVAAKPDDAGAWHDLGLARHHEGDDARALVALERARTLMPRDPRPRIALAALRWKRGDKAGATAEYRALLELDLPDRVRAKVEWALGELAKP
jgi:Flp pilus assembly protein TadD